MRGGQKTLVVSLMAAALISPVVAYPGAVGASVAQSVQDLAPRDATSVYQVTATTCGDSGTCESDEIVKGGSAAIYVSASPSKGEMRGAFVFRVMERVKGGDWKLTRRETAIVNPWAAVPRRQKLVSPSRTTQYRFVLEPACYAPGTTDGKCMLTESNVVTITVAKPGDKLRVGYLDSYIQVVRGDYANVTAVFESRTSQGTWTRRFPPKKVRIQRAVQGTWRTVDARATDDYGTVLFRVEPSGTRKYRLVVGRLKTPSVTVVVSPSEAATMHASWPARVSAFGRMAVRVSLKDRNGKPWEGNARVLLQYRANRLEAWTTIGDDIWQRADYVTIVGRVQGGGYYRVSVPEFSLQREMYYS